MNKLDMAHDYAKIILERMLAGDTDTLSYNEIASDAYQLADLMQAEADKREPKGFPEVLQDDWQPDWGAAPNNAMYWAMDESTLCNWYEKNPQIIDNQWDFGNVLEVSSSFNYQGDWKQSLRKRPQ